MKIRRTRRIGTRTIHGEGRCGPVRFGFVAHLHDYAAGDQRLVFQPLLVIDMGVKDDC